MKRYPHESLARSGEAIFQPIGQSVFDWALSAEAKREGHVCPPFPVPCHHQLFHCLACCRSMRQRAKAPVVP
jgi:hypothetical protein